MDEVWQAVTDYEGRYEVSSLGRVRVVKASSRAPVGYIMTLQISAEGYPKIMLVDDDRRLRRHFVHRLVIRAFLGDPPKLNLEVNHRDGNKTNNCIDNLEYVTRSENQQHRYRVLEKGRKFTKQEAAEIRDEFAGSDITLTGLARKHNASDEVMFDVVRCRGSYTE